MDQLIKKEEIDKNVKVVVIDNDMVSYVTGKSQIVADIRLLERFIRLSLNNNVKPLD